MAESTPPPVRQRVDSIDLLRGIVMVIMLLDHTRDFVHYAVMQGFDPTDLSHTSFKIFFTRWITHYCAPIFVFLAGTGAYLQLARGKSKASLSYFLVTRGFWLVVLEFTVVRCAAFLNFDYRFIGAAQVIWVIGVSMIVLAGLIHLPVRVVAAFGVLMIALHNLLDRFHVTGWRGPDTPVPSFWSKIFIFLHQGFEAVPILGWPSPVVFVIYPLIPWIGVMAVGYSLGTLYELAAERRRSLLLRMGIGATMLFFVLRATNVYGDPVHWSTQKNWVFTLISFFNVTKYPPSLVFLLMTLGPAMILLALFETSPLANGKAMIAKVKEFFITFGRVPLFFYILQWLMAHLTSIAAHLIAGKPVRWMFASQADGTAPPAGSGFNLAIVYLCWIAGVLLLYPLCKWFAGVKQRRRDWWLSYL
jgi:uncharacterized membrane protein